MRHKTTPVIFLSKANKIFTELQCEMVQSLVMPSLQKGKEYHE